MAKKGKNVDIVGKSVSFNVLDPDQKADLDFAEKRSNFSAFCRTLIRMERLRQENGITAFVPLSALEQPKEVEVADDDSMKGFI